MGKSMYYILIKNNRQVRIFINEKEMEEYMKKEDGNYYIISVYSTYISIEQYQVYSKKAYRIDVINM